VKLSRRESPTNVGQKADLPCSLLDTLARVNGAINMFRKKARKRRKWIHKRDRTLGKGSEKKGSRIWRENVGDLGSRSPDCICSPRQQGYAGQAHQDVIDETCSYGHGLQGCQGFCPPATRRDVAARP